MKLKIDQKKLLEAVNAVKIAVPGSKVKPILACVKLTATVGDHPENGELAIVATDTEVHIERTLKAEVTRPGVACVNCERLLSTVSLADEGEMEIVLGDAGLDFRQLFNEQTLPVQIAEEFPDWREDSGEFVAVEGADLARAFKCTAFASIGAEDKKFAVKESTLVQFDKTGIDIAATDTKRLSLYKIPGSYPKMGGIIPMKSVRLASANLTPGRVEMCITANAAVIRGNGWTMTSRLVSGRFPPYEKVIPKDAKFRLSLMSGLLLAKVRQASAATDAETMAMDVEIGGGKMKFRSESSGRGKAHSEMPLADSEAEFTARLDPSYVIDFLRVADSDSVMMELGTETQPVIFRSGERHRYMIQPMER